MNAISSQPRRQYPWYAEAFGFCGWVVVCVAFCAPSSAAVANSHSAPGKERALFYTNEIVPEKPWSIHVVRIERERKEFSFCTTMGKGATLGMGTVSEQLKSLPPNAGQPVAAINGDFYEKAEGYEGRPRDVQIWRGEVVSSPSGHTSFWIDLDGQPQMTNVSPLFRVIWPDGKTIIPIGLNEAREDDKAVAYSSAIGMSTRTGGGVEIVLDGVPGGAWLPLRIGKAYAARVQEVRNCGDTPVSKEKLVLSLGTQLAARLPALQAGEILQVVTGTVPDLTGVEVAIGGGPALVREGKLMQWKGFVHMRHPRTALGWNKDYFYLVQVDGRQNRSVGMTFEELAGYMLKLGCEYALNFDGGGSSTLWALGCVRNNPSEGQERPSPNALIVLKKR